MLDLGPGVSDAGYQKFLPRIDQDTAWKISIFPDGPLTFRYQYQKRATLEKVLSTGGTPVWQPSLPLNEKTGERKKEHEPSTIVLGQWTEDFKKSINTNFFLLSAV